MQLYTLQARLMVPNSVIELTLKLYIQILHPAKLSKGSAELQTCQHWLHRHVFTGTRLEAGTHSGKSVQQGIREMASHRRWRYRMTAAGMTFYRTRRKPEGLQMGPLTDPKCWAVCRADGIVSQASSLGCEFLQRYPICNQSNGCKWKWRYAFPCHQEFKAN